jgi:hypothetical protein
VIARSRERRVGASTIVGYVLMLAMCVAMAWALVTV